MESFLVLTKIEKNVSHFCQSWRSNLKQNIQRTIFFNSLKASNRLIEIIAHVNNNLNILQIPNVLDIFKKLYSPFNTMNMMVLTELCNTQTVIFFSYKHTKNCIWYMCIYAFFIFQVLSCEGKITTFYLTVIIFIYLRFNYRSITAYVIINCLRNFSYREFEEIKYWSYVN